MVGFLLSLFRSNFRPEVDCDIIYGVTIHVGYVSMDVHVKFGYSMSSGSRDNRGADFVLNERTNEHDEAYPNSVSPKNGYVRFVSKKVACGNVLSQSHRRCDQVFYVSLNIY